MTKIRLRGFENAPGQRHISADDRYLYHREVPRFRLVVIGDLVFLFSNSSVFVLLSFGSLAFPGVVATR